MLPALLRLVVLTVLAASVSTLAPDVAWAGTRAADGTLLSSRPCPANPISDYAGYFKSERDLLDEEGELAVGEHLTMPAISDTQLRTALDTPAQVADHIAYIGFECREIIYASGGLRIAGFLWKPVDTAGKQLPLLIVNRGGNAAFGAMEPWRYWGWHDFLKAGYVVLASQYRGGPGSEGADEFGGRDLDDVRALLPLARSLGYVDTDRVFMFGGSRGGMESYMLAHGGMRLRAMALRAGVADLFRAAVDRPVFDRTALARRMPDYADRQSAFTRRSAVRWASELDVPIVLFHGTADWRLNPLDSLDMATALIRAGKPVELHLYDGDEHGLVLNQRDMLARTINFFAKWGGPTPAVPSR